MRTAPAILAVVVVAVSAAGCGGGSGKSSSTSASASPLGGSGSGATIALTSDFKPGATISRRHTCDGRDVSPMLHVAGLPSATKEIVVVMRDPDAPGGTFIHWLIAGLEPAGGTLSLPAGSTPSGAVLGRNSFGSLGYRGPCPPSGAPHHYVITVYALGQSSGLRKGFSADDVSALPVLGQGTLTGLYGRR
ncbi:MAG TPA: YbhB/YbcL family Raf kinase inhibitor-like protein [Solirubrobacteraceae bacterium]|nr:YbhB/YbcL family Raf kinase inhibitor-like protein [Solirubrobacteraceae bacterium]